MAPRRPVQDELTKEQILRVARTLFSTKGYQGVSMRDIAREIGCSHGAIYYHFKNKGDLFDELLETGFHLLNATMEQVSAEKHGLKDLLIQFISFGFMYPHHYEIMFMSKEDAFLEHPAPVASYMRFVDEVGKFHVSPADAYFLFVSLHGFISYHLRSDRFAQNGPGMTESYVDFLVGRV